MPSRLKLHYLHHLRIYLFVHPSLAGIGSAGSCVDGKVRLDAEITPAVALGMAGRKPTTQHSAILEPQFWDLSLSASCVSRFSSRPQPSSRLVSAQYILCSYTRVCDFVESVRGSFRPSAAGTAQSDPSVFHHNVTSLDAVEMMPMTLLHCCQTSQTVVFDIFTALGRPSGAMLPVVPVQHRETAGSVIVAGS